jgi:hypothetical protein
VTTILAEAIYEAKEAAPLLHVSRRTLRRLPIACSVITARRVLYTGQDLLDYLDLTRVGTRRLRRVG